MHTPDLTQDNIARIRELFPNCVTEAKDKNGNITLAVDFDALRQELSANLVEGERERYRLDWPGKKEAMLAANAPIAKTLRPCRAESVDFDTTQNLFIEGDNLDALKLLQESYLGKIKMIYIDPPYNTGNDFIYKDTFAETTEQYLERSNQQDETGRLVANPESKGRFHSNWLSMMYPRLKLARNLLSDDGVIFISIDDKEQANLKKLCDEVFGLDNFIANLVWEKKKKGAFLSSSITNVKEYIYTYSKNINLFSGLIGEINSETETYPVIKTTNPRGTRTIKKGINSKYKEKNCIIEAGTKISSGNMELILLSDLVIKNGILYNDVSVDSNWIYSQDLLDKFAKEKSLYITQDLYFRRIVSDEREKKLKDLLPMFGDVTSGLDFKLSNNLFTDGWGTNEDGFNELHSLFQKQNIIPFPKPSKLISKLTLSACRLATNALILDFFAGSSTTAHAVMQLNAEDGGNRRFIMVQLPEVCDEKSEAARAGYKTIAEISKERIRRAGKKIREELAAKQKTVASGQGSLLDQAPAPVQELDTGFRVLKVDSSNMEDVFYTPDAVTQKTLMETVSNIKYDRTPEDLLFQVLLDWGVDLSLPIRREKLQGKTVFFVDENALIACFDKGITEDLVQELAGLQPLRAVFRDDGFVSDAVKINVDQIFRQLSPGTLVKSL